ncbi:hypothetical protein EYF80_009552 [Liparis tanakae]|uniref:Uncharacterized protein n=1 Tax=Liparis tanakae TaxID=230148 RepID=A0A4Z2IR24_9TELE|nr:hypothetical protein EYF80_009552 [Liparis tanakae]
MKLAMLSTDFHLADETQRRIETTKPNITAFPNVTLPRAARGQKLTRRGDGNTYRHWVRVRENEPSLGASHHAPKNRDGESMVGTDRREEDGEETGRKRAESRQRQRRQERRDMLTSLEMIDSPRLAREEWRGEQSRSLPGAAASCSPCHGTTAQAAAISTGLDWTWAGMSFHIRSLICAFSVSLTGRPHSHLGERVMGGGGGVDEERSKKGKGGGEVEKMQREECGLLETASSGAVEPAEHTDAILEEDIVWLPPTVSPDRMWQVEVFQAERGVTLPLPLQCWFGGDGSARSQKCFSSADRPGEQRARPGPSLMPSPVATDATWRPLSLQPARRLPHPHPTPFPLRPPFPSLPINEAADIPDLLSQLLQDLFFVTNLQQLESRGMHIYFDDHTHGTHRLGTLAFTLAPPPRRSVQPHMNGWREITEH